MIHSRYAVRSAGLRRFVAASAALLSLSLFAGGSPGVAQEPAQQQQQVQLTDDQLALNAEGFQAAIEGDLEKSVRLYRASLHQGEANVTWLNLGRALAGLGNCDEALEAYAKAERSPQVADPPPEEVATILVRFRGDLPEQCPGKLRIVCEPLTIEVRIDEAEARPCPAHALEVAPGAHTVLGVLGAQSVAESVEVRGLEEATVTLRIEPPVASDTSAPPAELPPVAPERSPVLAIAGWTTLGVGTAMVITGTLVGGLVVEPDLEAYREAAAEGDAATYNDLRSQVEAGQAAVLGLWIGGSLLAAGGLTLVILDFVLDDSETDARPDEAGAGLAPWLAPTGAGLQWTRHW